MQLNTLVKAGSLFFNVIRDDKVQELVKITHNGVKRRGLLSQPEPIVPQVHHIPFAPPYYRPKGRR